MEWSHFDVRVKSDDNQELSAKSKAKSLVIVLL